MKKPQPTVNARLPSGGWCAMTLGQKLSPKSMNTTSTLSDKRLKVIAVVSLTLLTVLIVTSFVLYWRVQNLQNSQPVVKVHGFYEFCEALAPEGGVVDLRVSREKDLAVVTVTAGSEAEFTRLKDLVTFSMLTTAASVEVRYGDQTYRYAPPAIP